MAKNKKIYLAGHRGMVGSAILRNLTTHGYGSIVVRTSVELDLRNQAKVSEFFFNERPQLVILAAAKVGGIYANSTRRAEFIYDNLAIAANVVNASYLSGVEKLLFLGSSCIYPRLAPQPMREEYLLTGKLEPTNQAYAIAKIAGIELCQSYRDQYGCNFISAMPTNIYGTNDNYDPATSHVLPSVVARFVNAKVSQEDSVVVWGSGMQRREFLHVDDLSDACRVLLEGYNGREIVNIGVGSDITIAELAVEIASACDYKGDILYNKSRPDGTPRKLLDVSKMLCFGWKPNIGLKAGIRRTISEYVRAAKLDKHFTSLLAEA